MIFDVVVACSATIRNFKGRGRSVDYHFTPNFVARRTKAGHALMLALPGLCGITNILHKRLGPNPFPTVIWFDDAGDLTLGTAYYSEDAYINPNSRLSFDSIEITEATLKDWEAWIETRPENLVTREMVQKPRLALGKRFSGGVRPPPKTFARRCHGVGRVKLPDSVRVKIRKLWPSHKPRYWTVPFGKGPNGLRMILHGNKGRDPDSVPLFNKYPLNQYWFGGTRGDGQMVPTRALGHALFHLANNYPGSESRYYPAEYFPLFGPMGVPFWRKDFNQREELFADIKLDGGRNQGFLACYFRSTAPPPRTWEKIRYRFDGVVADTKGKSVGEPSYIFERDEYVYQLFLDHLGGMGDVF